MRADTHTTIRMEPVNKFVSRESIKRMTGPVSIGDYRRVYYTLREEVYFSITGIRSKDEIDLRGKKHIWMVWEGEYPPLGDYKRQLRKKKRLLIRKQDKRYGDDPEFG